MGKFYQCIQSYGPSFITKFCSALYLENLLTNIFAELNLRGGVSCMPAALLLKLSVYETQCMLHYENMPMQYTEIFKSVKIEKFQKKNFDIFLIFAQNINCGYTLEPPR